MQKYTVVIFSILVAVLFTAGCTSDTGNKTTSGDTGFKLVSSAFANGSAIPQKYTANGDDVSPPLSWSSAPNATKSFVIICEDQDAPGGNFTHWVVFNIPSTAKELPEGIKNQRTLDNGAKQGTNDFGQIGYGGPAPPSGSPHRYYFKLYALDIQLNLEAGATKNQVLQAMQGHILAETQLTGTYGR